MMRLCTVAKRWPQRQQISWFLCVFALHHDAYAPMMVSLLDDVVNMGMALVFERRRQVRRCQPAVYSGKRTVNF